MYYIEETNFLDNEFIDSNEWDVIKLNIKLDQIALEDYLTQITTKFPHFSFNFNDPTYLNKETYDRFKTEHRVTNYIGDITGWTLSWPIDRDIPIPSQSHLNPLLFPELDEFDLYYDSKLMERYNFGYLTSIFDKLGDQALRQLIMTKHLPGVKTLTHVDSKRKKLHIPLKSEEGCIFHFGDNGERKYYMEVGNMYLINPSVPHGTDNQSGYDRYHLISRVDMDYIPKILELSGTLINNIK